MLVICAALCCVSAELRAQEALDGHAEASEVSGGEASVEAESSEGGAEDGSDADEGSESGYSFGARASVGRGTGPRMPAATTEFEFAPRALRQVPRASAESWLTLAPGVFLVNHSGTYHASTLLLRGFDAGEGRDVEFLVAGAPINEPSNPHGHGYADTHFLIPELVGSLRVTEGPFAAAQSDFAVAGTAHYELGVERRGVLVRGELGSFDTRRLLLAWAPVGASEGTFVGVDVRDSAGYGRARRATSFALNAGFETALLPELSLRLFAALHFADFSSAGIVRQDDVRAATLPCDRDRDAQFYCAADPDQGGATQRALLSARLLWRRPGAAFHTTFFGGWRNLRVRENFTGFLLDPRGDGLDEQYEVATLGARGGYQTEFEALDQTQSVELGYVARHDTGVGRILRRRAEDGLPYAADLDDELRITHVGAHVGTDLRFADFIGLRAALRVDGFAFSTRDRAEPDADRMGERLPELSSDAYGVSLGPRGTLRVRLADLGASGALEWQTSAGLGTRSSDASALSTGEVAPFARVIASETGLAMRFVKTGVLALDARVAAYHTYVDQDLIFDAERGRNVFQGSTSRLGALAWAQLQLGGWLELAASFAWSEAFLFRAGASWSDWVSDERVPFVPRFVARVDAATTHQVELEGERFVLGVGLGLGILGERPLPLGQSARSVILLDVSARLSWRALTLGVQVTNAADQRYASSVFRHPSRFDPDALDTRLPSTHFAAGPPLAAQVSLTVAFDETDPFGPAPALEPTPPR